MLKKTPHQRRVELGNWLEELLNPNINKWDIYQVINKALTLLNIDCPLDKRYYFFQLIENSKQKEHQSLNDEFERCYPQILDYIFYLEQFWYLTENEYGSGSPDFEEIEEEESELVESQKKICWPILPQVTFYEMVPTGEDHDLLCHLQTMSFAQDKLTKELKQEFLSKYNLPKLQTPFGIKALPKKYQERFDDEVRNNPKRTVFDKRIIPFVRLKQPIADVVEFFLQRKTISILLKQIKEQDRPWNLLIPEYCNEILNDRHTPGMVTRTDVKTILFRLISAYNKLNEQLHIKDQSITLERNLLTDYFRPEINSEESIPKYFALPTDVLISKIFFDFLLLGGQNYYGFCEYCDSFFVIERKNRKKFCSDVCRTLNQRK